MLSFLKTLKGRTLKNISDIDVEKPMIELKSVIKWQVSAAGLRLDINKRFLHRGPSPEILVAEMYLLNDWP